MRLDCLEMAGKGLTVCDERTRAGGEAPNGAVASVTLCSDDGDETWGEFMCREDALALYGWLALLLGATP